MAHCGRNSIDTQYYYWGTVIVGTAFVAGCEHGNGCGANRPDNCQAHGWLLVSDNEVNIAPNSINQHTCIFLDTLFGLLVLICSDFITDIHITCGSLSTKATFPSFLRISVFPFNWYSLSSAYYRMSVLRTLTLLTLGATIALAQRRLALPDPRSCANRKYHIPLLNFFMRKYALFLGCQQIMRLINNNVELMLFAHQQTVINNSLLFFANIHVSRFIIHTQTMCSGES